MDASTHWFRVALALSLGPAISNGFARFCYALVLPSMQASLNWSYTEAGALHGANALGYLLGAVSAPAFMRRFGAKRVFRDTIFVTTASLLVMALASRYDVFLALRFVGGVSSALTFIAGGVLAATLTDDPRRSSAALAIYFSGIGFAMFLSGLVLPAFFAIAGDGAWAFAWLGLGLAALVAAFTAAWGASKVAPNAGSAVGARAAVPWRRLVPIVLCYFSFGLGHVGYMTFIVA
ncbi:MAG: YbfB/YjiJ family MFS transporter, partial [Burkholderiales bacterium]